MLKNLNIRSGGTLKSILVLMSGTVIAQIMSYLATPFITRLFTPSEIGELGVFLRVAAFITAIATARYELTLPLPKNQNHAFQLFRLTLKITFISLGVLIIIGLGYWIWSGFNISILYYLLLLTSTSFFLIFKNIGTNWSIRNQSFKSISISNILGASFTNGMKIIAGIFNVGVIGLIISHFVGSIMGVIVFVKEFFINKKAVGLEKSNAKMKVLAKNYKDFPQVNLPHALLDSGRELIIAFFFVEYLDQAIFGSYDHSVRMLKLPLVIIGASIGQVFFNKSSISFSNKEGIYPILKKTTLQLAMLSIVPFSIVFLFGEELFTLVFGDEWAYSGKISEIIAPWLMINFISSPISTIPLIIGKQKLFFFLGLISTSIQVAGFGLLPILVKQEIITIDQLFSIISISMSLYLVIVIFIKLKVTKNADNHNLSIEN